MTGFLADLKRLLVLLACLTVLIPNLRRIDSLVCVPELDYLFCSFRGDFTYMRYMAF